ncbi:MAG TPA: trehalose-6-phosphate synthase [Vineibacter sp.]|nr:trehalose-6-phosphate synthase [Vineibacter sp.]
MGRLVVVSNRVPASGRAPDAGGLAVGLAEALRGDALWFGWSGEISGHNATEAHISSAGNVTYATVDLSTDEYNRFYVGFANGSLWPLFHFRIGLMEFRREYLEGYLAVNRKFAAALLPLLRPDDTIWVHDYHFMPFAEELRRLGVRNRTGFFLHTPFVPASVFAALPQGEKLLEAMCSYDVVGFQTEPDRLGFLDCLHQLLGVEIGDGRRIFRGDRTITVLTNPIGIDPDSFAHDARRTARSSEARRLQESLVGRALILGVERLDYSKGLPQRFEGFRRLLSRFPDHRQKVSYLQIAARSRQDVNQYRALRRELDQLAGNINGRFAEFDWVPLRYMTRSLTRSTLAGFHRISRVGLVTPLRDGMNLVAKEYIAAQDPADPGVLVLSRFAGAARELDAALLVNPFDPDEIAESLHLALAMPAEERVSRHAALLEKVRAVTARTWSQRMLEALEEAPAAAAQPASIDIVP